MSVRWPRCLTPTYLSQIIRDQKNPLRALQLFTEAKSRYATYRHNGPVYATMIDILGTAGKLADMKELINQMKEDSCECKDSVFNSAIKTYAKAGLLDEAISLFKSIPQFNCVNWTESFNTLLQIMVNEEKFETAYHLYLMNANKWEVKTSIRSLNVLIDALCRRSRSDLALSIFQDMNTQCCYPDRETYRILMRGLCEDGRLNEATHLLYNMFWRISKKGSGEDVVIYRTLLEALCDKGMVEEALEILGKISRKALKAPKNRYRNLGLSQGLESEDVEKIKALINEFLVRGGVPSLASYSAMATDLYSEGKIEDGNRVFNELIERGFRPLVSTYDGKMVALCRERKVDAAANLIDKEMIDANCVPTVRTFNILLKGLYDEGKSMSAIKYFNKMYNQMGCVPNKATYDIMVDGLCAEGHFVEACQIFEKMLVRRHWPSDAAFNKLIGGLCASGKRYEAVIWLEEMISQGKIPDVSLWSLLLSSMCSNSAEAGACLNAVHKLTES
ncbi:hypothetical protein Syun_021379 [Stephania yunnanensis]|uniref:Pentatricopeptide repeat-containing protein n=1 Tax=Stephania yunnanensis TaxID=152371 RepID=A0AAP0IFW7_9MAGN